MACFDALWNSFKGNVPATEGLAPNVHSLYMHIFVNKLGVRRDGGISEYPSP